MALTLFIERYLPLIDEKIRSYLRFDLRDERQVLGEAMLYSFAAGKRVRSLLAIAGYLLFDDADNRLEVGQILPLCCAIEMIHTYSLIHDDLPAMDNDDYRRGQLTNHKKFGEGVAILAGDALNTYAFEVLARELGAYFPSDRVLLAITHFAKALGTNGMAGGQVLDIKREGKTCEDLEKMHHMKTGVLISASVSLPAMLLNRSAEDIAILNSFGEHLGILFQIVDDILDTTGTRESLGKTAHKDADQKKLTYLSLYGMEKSRQLAEERSAQAKQIISQFEGKNTEILEAFVDYVIERSH